MRITLLLTWLLASLVCAVVIDGRSRFSAPLTPIDTEAEKPSPLQLTIKVVSSEYCVGDSELDSLRLKVHFVYTNAGGQRLILYKGTPLLSRMMISRNSTDAAAKRFEVNSSLTQVTSGGTKCYKGSAPNSCFITLPPGDSYEVETTIGFFVVRGDVREITGAVQSGDHILQVEVPTWHESNKLAKELSSCWQQYGILWYEPITSAPLPVRVDKERKIADCP